MKIVIFGANGKTGTLLTEQALVKGHHVTAYVRRPGSMVQQHSNLKVITGNLDDAVRLREAIAGSDAVLSTLGDNSLTKHSPEIIAGINLIISTIEKEGVKRMIYLSSMGAGNSRKMMGLLVRFFIAGIMLRVPLADHTANEQSIEKSNLRWTVVRPAGLTNGPKTGRLKHGSKIVVLKGTPQVSRANVASFMLDQLSDITYLNKSAWVYG